MRSLEETVLRLCDLSRQRPIDPHSAIDWPERLEPGQWFTSPELISIYGTPRWEQLDETARARLSFHEAVNFCSLNVHGEKTLIEGLARRSYPPGAGVWETSSPYLHHFLEEENRHLVYFAGFCRRYAGKLYSDRKLAFPRQHVPGEEDFLFVARVLVFEEVGAAFNQRMAVDERLAPIARKINQLHHQDESRHLVFGRQLVGELFARHAREWSGPTLEGVRAYLAAYLQATWREYYNPEVYADAGLEGPYELAEEAYRHEGRRALRREMSSGLVRHLLELGILAREPAL